MSEHVTKNDSVLNLSDRGGKGCNSIYLYFKKHPALLFTCISALIAIISALINMIVFCGNTIYLRHWNIDLNHIANSNISQHYYILGSLCYVLSCMFIGGYTETINQSCQFYRRILVTCQENLKIIQKEINKGKTRINLVDQKVQRNDSCKRFSAEVNDITKDLKKLERRLNKSNKRLKKISNMQLAMQLSKLIFPGFVMLLAFLVWELNSKGLSYDTLGTWGLSMCSIVAIIIVKEIIARKRIRKEFLRKNRSIKDVIRNSRELLETNDDY